MLRWPGLVFALALYALAAFALLDYPGLFSGRTYLGNADDPSLYVWMFRFLPDAVAHLHNPFILAPAWAPVGLNITQGTTTPLLALLAWPLTACLGPVAAFNIVSMSAPALAATSCFALARHYTPSWPAAFVAGWIFGFSTAVFAPLFGHLQTDFVAFLPLAFLAVARYAAGCLSFAGFVFWSALVLAAQFLVSLENFVTEAIYLSLFALLLELARPRGLFNLFRRRRENLLLALLAAYAVVGVFVSPFIYYFFRSYAQMPPILQDGGAFPLTLLNLIVPTTVTWLGSGWALPLSRAFPGNYSEDFGYIGAPLLLITLFAVWRLRRQPRAWPFFAVLACSFLFALGPRLVLLSRPTIPLPWALIGKLPLLGNALPGRMMIFTMLAIAGLFALWLGSLPRRLQWPAIGLVAASLLLVLPSTWVRPGLWRAPLPVPALFAGDLYKRVIQPGDRVLFLPLSPSNGNAMFWQVETRGYFQMVNGYGNFIPPGLLGWPAVSMLGANVTSLGFVPQFQRFARAAGIDEVIVPAALLPVWRAPLVAAGWAPRPLGDLTVFRPVSPDTAPEVSEAEAQYQFQAAHFASLKAAAACLLARKPAPLDIAGAVGAGCLPADFAPINADPGQNWDKLGGWMGNFGNGVGIGVSTDPATAARLIAATGAGALAVYFPYPRLYKPGHTAGPRAQLLELFPKAVIAAGK